MGSYCQRLGKLHEEKESIYKSKLFSSYYFIKIDVWFTNTYENDQQQTMSHLFPFFNPFKMDLNENERLFTRYFIEPCAASWNFELLKSIEIVYHARKDFHNSFIFL